MKKLLLLFLVLTGMASTASADDVIIYVQNNCSWTDLKVYINDGTKANDWPGVKINTGSAVTEVVDGITYYEVNLGNCTKFGLNNGSKEQTHDVTTGSVTSGCFYSFGFDYEWDGTKYYNLNTDGTTTYTYNFTVTTASSWDEFRIALWNPSTSAGISGFAYPGKVVSGTDKVYSYTHKSFLSTLGVLFADASDETTLKTGDMTASSGTNKYYISTITKDGGQGIKTNASGYSTAVSSGNLDMTSGIAYVAEDKGIWAQAHTITGIYYGNPFLVAGEASTTYHFAYGTGDDLPCTNAFKKGSDAGIDGGSGPYNYILKGDAFYRANGNTVASTKAYLQLSGEVPTGARALIFEDGETTAIKAIDNSQLTIDNYYDLQGRKVAQPTKGLYIVNGKKVIVK